MGPAAGSSVNTIDPAERRFEQVYEDHFDAIFRYLLHRVADVSLAEDLTAQTFFKAYRAFPRFRHREGKVSSWLYRIATNELNSHLRRPRTASLEAGFGDVRVERENAERILERHTAFLEVNQVLRTLKPEDQALVALRYFEQKPFAEIAEILGRSTRVLTVRTHRALTRLRRELDRRGMDHEGLRKALDRSAEAGC